MVKYNTGLISKGLFGLAVVAIAGVVGAVHFASAATNDNTSGYGTTGQQAQAAADKFALNIVNDSLTFYPEVQSLQKTAQDQLKQNGVTDFNTFDSNFNAATQVYFTSISTAFQNFQNQVNADANTATSKDQFIDAFNHAKADYLNQLDAAKNQLADSLSKLSGNGNVVKDQFIGGYNHARDNYSNQLEAAKNDFAATISNL